MSLNQGLVNQQLRFAVSLGTSASGRPQDRRAPEAKVSFPPFLPGFAHGLRRRAAKLGRVTRRGIPAVGYPPWHTRRGIPAVGSPPWVTPCLSETEASSGHNT